jgi:hypothetical protein
MVYDVKVRGIAKLMSSKINSGTRFTLRFRGPVKLQEAEEAMNVPPLKNERDYQ